MYELGFFVANGILEVKISGTGNRENAGEIAAKVINSARESRPKGALIDLRSIQGRLGIVDIFNLIRSIPRDIPRIKAAIVDREENRYQMEFLETVSVNEGHTTRYFTDIDQARSWLKT